MTFQIDPFMMDLSIYQYEPGNDVKEKLLKVSRKSDDSMQAILVAAGAALLYHNTGNDRILFKTSGPANTTFLMDAEISNTTSFKELLITIRKNMAAGLPLIEDDKKEIPAFIYNSLQEEAGNLLFSFQRNEDDIRCEVKYNEAIYSDSYVAGLCNQYDCILRTLLAEPDKQVCDISLLTPAEEEQVLYSFNSTSKSYHEYTSMPDQLTAVFRNKSEYTALVHDEISCTYGELQHKASCIAARLLSGGLTTGTIVGVLMEPSVHFVASVLGVMMAGGIYLPIDTTYPFSRKKYIFNDTGLAYLLSESQYIFENFDLLQDIDFDRIIDVTDESLYQEELNGIINHAGAEDVAYIIYTSGSTGNPKGVPIRHKSLLNYLTWASAEYVKENNSMALFTSIGFDLTITSLFLPLITGSTLYIYSDNQQQLPIERIIADEKVTLLKLTPAHLKIIRERGLSNSVIKRMIVGGEILPVQLADDICTLFNDNIELYNEYGPTEATVGCMIYRYSRQESMRADSVLIGKPAPNCEMYVLNEKGHPVPFGAQGELYIGGIQLSPGYFRNDELNAGRFIDHPFREDAVLYKTGDFGRLYPDGNILYTGRKDEQVKIRGYRIELGEITHALLQHGAVTDAVVIVRNDNNGEKLLYAFYVSAAEPGQQEIREYLAEQLPAYMVPDILIRLSAMPLTRNGKIDRDALPWAVVSEHGAVAETDGVIESELMNIWSEVLAIDKNSLDTNSHFFHIGGHSLKALSLTFFLSKKLHVKVEIKDVFKHPTIRSLAAFIAGLTRSEDSGIMPAEIKPFYNLSAAQERMYILQQIDTDSITYNMPFIFELPEAHDLAQMEGCLAQLIERHTSLRTVFMEQEGSPRQCILSPFTVTPEIIEAGDLSLTEVMQSFVRPFNLQEPLIRMAYVYYKGKPGGTLIIDVHHIINDGISQAVLEQEFRLLTEGKPLPPVSFQYIDYIEWQQKNVYAEELERNKHYWLLDLAGALPVLELPYDHVRPKKQCHDGGVLSLQLGSELSARIRQLSKQEDVTVFMLLLSLWKILLARLSGQEDLLVGIPVAGRNHPDLQSIVGMFVNTLVIRSKANGNKTCKEYFREVREKTLSAYQHQEYPFELLVDKLVKERDMGRPPLFSVVFNYMKQDHKEDDFIPEGNVQVEEALVSKYDLTLTAVEQENSLLLRMEYSKGLFEQETVTRYLRYFSLLTKAVCAAPELMLKDIHILPPDELALLDKWNDTTHLHELTSTVVEKIEERVRISPDNIAIIEAHQHFSYASLNTRANLIANALIAEGIRKGDRVAVMLPASFELYAAFLGVLKAGAVLVPIDGTYPEERIRRIAEHSGANILLTQELISHLDSNAVSDQNPLLQAGPSDIAYIIYTSGTTGEPNGVKVSHRALMNLCGWHNRYYGITEKDRTAKYAKIGFDASIWEIFPYLLAGASTYIIDEAARYDMPALSALFEKEAVSVCFLPTPVAEEFMQTGNNSLRCLLTGGDKLKKFNAGQIKYALFNNYGPTEYTVVATVHEVTKSQTNIPIGKPIDNTQIYILHPEGNALQPMGVAGELCIGGAGLAEGYYNNEALTLQKFVAHPFSEGQRIYRTGDMARWTKEGTIEYLGRKDTQVKIRGHRIELGEIESVLNRYPGIRRCLANVFRQNAEEKLCAYYIADDKFKKAELTAFLQKYLPSYMIPVSFNRVPEFPLGVNEKLDVSALPMPVFESDEQYVKPLDNLEIEVVAIWAELLGISPSLIGVRHNFFEIGGNSMKAVKLRAMLEEKIGIHLPVVTIFEHPTIAAFVKSILKQEEVSLETQQTLRESEDMLAQTIRIIGDL